MNIKEYIKHMSGLLPMQVCYGGLYAGDTGMYRMADDIGYALADFDPKETAKIYKQLYSELVVKSFFRAGLPVAIDSGEFIELVKKSESDRRQWM